jgi:CBS domain containing-hemolysin-like protein
MSDLERIAWYAAGAAATLGSALCSGIEIGTYTINRVRLHVAAHVPRSNAAVLERLIQQPNRLLATLLIGNNIANFAASLAISALTAGASASPWRGILLDVLLLTPLLLIFGEIVPKDLFRANADRLTCWFARPVAAAHRLLTWIGLIPLLNQLDGLLHRLAGQRDQPSDISQPRRHMSQLVREGVGHGVITAYQSEMIDRVLQISQLSVRDVLRPWSKVTYAETVQPPESIWLLADRVPYTRLPLLNRDGKPVGLLNINQVLRHHPAACPSFEAIAGPLAIVAPTLSLREALRQLQRQGTSMAVVVERDKPIGIVTAKDLVEPIVGPLWAW